MGIRKMDFVWFLQSTHKGGDRGMTTVHERISLKAEGGRHRISLEGEFDISNAHLIAEALANFQSSDMIFDLTETIFLDAVTIGKLLRHGQTVRENGKCAVFVSGENHLPNRILEILQIAKHFEVFPDIQTAHQYFDALRN